MKKCLLWLIVPWLVWACNSLPNNPSQPTTFSAKYVSSLAKVEVKTSIDRHVLNVDLFITNIADITIYPGTDRLGRSLIFTIYNSYGDELNSFYERDFEQDYWDIGLKTGFTYSKTYLVDSQRLPTQLRYGKIKIRLIVQNNYGTISTPCEVWVNYDFGSY